MPLLFDYESHSFSLSDFPSNLHRPPLDTFDAKQLGDLWTKHIIVRQNTFLMEFNEDRKNQGAWALGLAACNFNNELTSSLLIQAVQNGLSPSELVRLVLHTKSDAAIPYLKHVGVDVWQDETETELGFTTTNMNPTQPLEVLIESRFYPDRQGRYERALRKSPIWEAALNFRATPCLLAMMEEPGFSPDLRLSSRTVNNQDKKSSLLASAIGFDNFEVALAILEKSNPNQDTLDEALLACVQVRGELMDRENNEPLLKKVVQALIKKKANPAREWALRGDGLNSSLLYDQHEIQDYYYNRIQDQSVPALTVSAQKHLLFHSGEYYALKSWEKTAFFSTLNFSKKEELQLKEAFLNLNIHDDPGRNTMNSKTGYALFTQSYPWSEEEWKLAVLKTADRMKNQEAYGIWDRLMQDPHHQLDHHTLNEVVDLLFNEDHIEELWKHPIRQKSLMNKFPLEIKLLWDGTLGKYLHHYESGSKKSRYDQEQRNELSLDAAMNDFKNFSPQQPRRAGPRL